MKLPTFRRLFAANFRKNRYIPLACMTFSSDFVSGENGNMYPRVSRNGDFAECVTKNAWCVTGSGAVARAFARHFPYATYRVALSSLSGCAGILLRHENFTVTVAVSSDGRVFCDVSGARQEQACPLCAAGRFLFTFRADAVDVYREDDGLPVCLASFTLPELSLRRERVWRETAACVYAAGDVRLSLADQVIDCGISQADIRPVTDTEGNVLLKDGRVHLTFTARMEKGGYQAVFSWLPGTADFQLTGALFFDTGDGLTCADVATSLKFDRETGDWLLWVCSFSHGHILGHARLAGDPRFGLHIVDLTLMPPMPAGAPDTAFYGKEGDEDPDFLYDRAAGVWHMTVCRLTDCGGKTAYRYFHFTSRDPFDGYVFRDVTAGEEETGGSLIRLPDGRPGFLCGANFSARAEYHVYDLSDLSRFDTLSFDYDDGGFRGWGSCFTLPSGTRTRRFLLTFDRMKASGYNWSYGNLYGFEADF